MQIKSVRTQNFGMALKCYPNLSKIQYHIALKHNMDKTIKADHILDQLKENKALTTLYLEETGNGARLNAVVGDKIFKENFFNSSYRVLKKALKESNEQSHIELIADVLKTLSKDFD